MGYAKHFNHELYTVPEFLLTDAGWEDVSYGNDMCPRFENKELGIAVWVDAVDKDQREHDDWSQYAVVGLNQDGTLQDDSLMATENAANLERWIGYWGVMRKFDDLMDTINESVVPLPEVADEVVLLIAQLQTMMDSLKD